MQKAKEFRRRFGECFFMCSTKKKSTTSLKWTRFNDKFTKIAAVSSNWHAWRAGNSRLETLLLLIVIPLWLLLMMMSFFEGSILRITLIFTQLSNNFEVKLFSLSSLFQWSVKTVTQIQVINDVIIWFSNRGFFFWEITKRI